MLRSAAAIAAGINPWTLHALVETGAIERVARGLYRLTEAEPMRAPDLATVAAKVPQAVVCLISALDWHGLTTQIPHEVHVALRRSAHKPRLSYPPLRVYWVTEPCYSAGIEVHEVDGVAVRIYGPEKTLADCFKFRREVGLDTALEGLWLYAERRPVRTEALFEFAQLCRVRNVMRPYLEALL
jgi:predicted transcriptional regulator of viral defense system